METSPVSGSFFACRVPELLRRNYELLGGRSLARFAASVRDGLLRVQFGYEPAGRQGGLLLHVSLSVGKTGDLHPFRRPTDDEVEAVKRGLWSLVQFEESRGAVDLAEEPSQHPHVRHLWEIET